MRGHGLITEQSRKYKAARQVYELLRNQHHTSQAVPDCQWEDIRGGEGIQIPTEERYRVLNLRILDEHLSPYFKTDMNLFHLLMIDESIDMSIFKAENGWLLVFDGIPQGPQPFGQDGFDNR